MTSEAPERIWAYHAPEVEPNYPGCTIVAGEKCMHGAAPYVLTSTLAAAEERHEVEIICAYGGAANARPEAYAVYGSDRTDAYAKGYCAGVEAYYACIRSLTPADATAALDAMLAKVRAEGIRGGCMSTDAFNAALSAAREAGVRKAAELAANRGFQTVAQDILALLDDKEGR